MGAKIAKVQWKAGKNKDKDREAIVIQLHKTPENDEKYPFNFGISKAKLVVKHIEDIKKFVAYMNKQAETKPVEPANDFENLLTQL